METLLQFAQQPNSYFLHLEYDKTFQMQASGSPRPAAKFQLRNPKQCQKRHGNPLPPSVLHKSFSSLFDFPSNHSCRIFDEPFNIRELESIIKSLKIRSSPGLDKIDYNLISSLPDFFWPILLNIFNDLLSKGAFPHSWHHSLVFLIPKNTPGTFPPISLTSCCLKLIEKLILSRLDWWIKKNRLLPKCQSGFRKNKSCHDNISMLSTEIYNGFVSRQSTACVFLDIAGAFDNVIPNILIDDPIEMGLSPKICLFIYNLIHFRELQFVINGELTEPRFLHKRVPQGSILSPILFNIYVAKCMKCTSKECEIIQFADDIAIFARSTRIDLSLRALETFTYKLASFLKFRGLDISPHKSALVVFSRKRIDPFSFCINLCGVSIKSSSHHKFLGITLDYKINRHKFIESLKRKCVKLTNIIRSLRGIWWGASPCLLINIYKSLVRSSMEYGCFILPTNSHKYMYKFEKIQNRALKFCIGLRQSSPSNVVLAETCTSSLKNRFLLFASNYILKAFAVEDNPIIDKPYDLQINLIKNSRFNISKIFLLYKAFIAYKKYKSKIAFFPGPPSIISLMNPKIFILA
ncbi:pol-like protein [Lasius niger]|uniref:Pol-like protein n=1 Tax=Lasius niger TaxID=67767 RepID=A0A0J7K4D8_LASNI|nr:pol-like protein [Lasius niger]